MTTGVPINVIWTPWVEQPLNAPADGIAFANCVRDVSILTGACLAIRKGNIRRGRKV